MKFTHSVIVALLLIALVISSSSTPKVSATVTQLMYEDFNEASDRYNWHDRTTQSNAWTVADGVLKHEEWLGDGSHRWLAYDERVWFGRTQLVRVDFKWTEWCYSYGTIQNPEAGVHVLHQNGYRGYLLCRIVYRRQSNAWYFELYEYDNDVWKNFQQYQIYSGLNSLQTNVWYKLTVMVDDDDGDLDYTIQMQLAQGGTLLKWYIFSTEVNYKRKFGTVAVHVSGAKIHFDNFYVYGDTQYVTPSPIRQCVPNPTVDDTSKWLCFLANHWDYDSYSVIDQGKWCFKIVEDDAEDWGDAVAGVGRRPHGSGAYWKVALNYEPTYYWYWHQCSNPSFKVYGGSALQYQSNTNKWTLAFYKQPPPTKAPSACVSVGVNLYFELYCYNYNTGQYFWKNYDEPDPWEGEDMLVIEFLFRYEMTADGWTPVDYYRDKRYTFISDFTSHDYDLHYIITSHRHWHDDIWTSRVLDIGEAIKEFIEHFNTNEDRIRLGLPPLNPLLTRAPYGYYIEGVRLKAVSLTSEAIGSQWQGFGDNAYLKIYDSNV